MFSSRSLPRPLVAFTSSIALLIALTALIDNFYHDSFKQLSAKAISAIPQTPSIFTFEHTPFHHAKSSSTCGACEQSPGICQKFGSRALLKSRVYDGSGDKTQRFLEKARSGKGINFAILGGSVSLGNECPKNRYHDLVYRWLGERFPSPHNVYTDGAVGARGSNYFKFCHATLIPPEADIILVETAINDWQMGDTSFANMEQLIRSLLEYPSRPLVILVHSFKIDSWLATGGDSQLGLANYYDIPVISTRPVFLPALLQNHSLADEYYTMRPAKDESGKDILKLDGLHPNCFGHEAIGSFVISYLEEQACKSNHPDRIVRPSVDSELLQLGMHDGLTLPRQRLGIRYVPDLTEPTIVPTCLSLDNKREGKAMTPIQNNGWDLYVLPEHQNKKFWRSQTPGNWISFEVQTLIGDVSIYALRSTRLGLGKARCWVDDDIAHSTILNGWWELPYSVGEEFRLTLGPLTPGSHTVHCEVLNETEDPAGGHTFLLIGVASI